MVEEYLQGLIRKVWKRAKDKDQIDYYDQGHYIGSKYREHFESFDQFWEEEGELLLKTYSEKIRQNEQG
jgi:hypothetical protein